MKKILGILVFIFTSVFVIIIYLNQDQTEDFFEDYVYRILELYVQKGFFSTPDLSIDQIVVKKTSNPTEKFNFYKYSADVFIKNSGGQLSSARVELTNDNEQIPYVVENSEEGFSLRKDDTYILRDYQLLFDGQYNGGEIGVYLDVKNKGKRVMDDDLENNNYYVHFFELPAQLKNIEVDGVLSDGTLILNFDLPARVKNIFDFEVVSSNSVSFPENRMQYTESTIGKNLDEIYSYFRIPNDEEIVRSKLWERKITTYLSSKLLSVRDKNDYHFYIKATNPENGSFVVSDILFFPESETMNRAELAKLFVEEAEIDLFYDGLTFYSDVPNDKWFFPYVQTIYNLGLTDIYSENFYPENQATRSDVLKLVMNYFDVNLASRVNRSRFADVSESHEIYPYAQALYASSGAEFLADNFKPDAPASRNFLKYLIYEYKKNN